jgi:hypothetical protein
LTMARLKPWSPYLCLPCSWDHKHTITPSLLIQIGFLTFLQSQPGTSVLLISTSRVAGIKDMNHPLGLPQS